MDSCMNKKLNEMITNNNNNNNSHPVTDAASFFKDHIIANPLPFHHSLLEPGKLATFIDWFYCTNFISSAFPCKMSQQKET